MKRSCVVSSLVRRFSDALFVSCNGFNSRELYKADDHQNFYMLGSMGLATSIGIGVAAASQKLVIVLEGDGNVMMMPASLSAAKTLDVTNLVIVILDNRVYESTGGQPCPHMNFIHLGLATGLPRDRIVQCEDEASLESALSNIVAPIDGPLLIICQTKAEPPPPRVALAPPAIADGFILKLSK